MNATHPLQAESLGRMLPRLLLPYAQQWAERAGLQFLSRLLTDDQLRELIERYADELFVQVAKQRSNAGRVLHAVPTVEAQAGEASAEPDELRIRLRTVQAQHEMLLGMLNGVRSKIRPLASALGCCPECLVGVTGCPNCLGRSAVGYYEPDRALLETEVINPLAARGVPLATGDKSSATRKRSRQWPTK